MPTGRQGNLIVTSTKTVSDSELRRQFIEEIKKQGKPYGLSFEDIQGGFTMTPRGTHTLGSINHLAIFGTEYLELLGARVDELRSESGNVRVGEDIGLSLVERWTSTDAAWDEFEDAYLDGIQSYARERSDDPDVPAMLDRIRRWRQGYLRWGRQTLGFGVYVFRPGP